MMLVGLSIIATLVIAVLYVRVKREDDAREATQLPDTWRAPRSDR